MTSQPLPPESLVAAIDVFSALTIDRGFATSVTAPGGNTVGDSTKSWAVNIHANRLLKIVSGLGAGQQAVITGNSANVLVVNGVWTLGIGIAAEYVILDIDMAQVMRDVFGSGANISADNPLPVTAETALDHGIATGGTVNTLIDTTKG